jgi:riboflavin synthase
VFTGIVEETGELVERTGNGGGAGLTIRGPLVTSDVQPGDSVAVNGVCLTVVAVGPDTFTVDVMKETLARSTLGGLDPPARVNLERAVTVATRLGGHLVQGHVDGVGRLLARTPGPAWDEIRVGVPPGLSRYVVEKGSITVDGVSLTVVAVGEDWLDVGLIPATLRLTTLGRARVGDPLNLEVDVIAKYVEKLLAGARS